jgi:hypothetical protein
MKWAAIKAANAKKGIKEMKFVVKIRGLRGMYVVDERKN